MSTFWIILIFILTVAGLWIVVGLINFANSIRKRAFLLSNGWLSVFQEKEPFILREIFIKETDSGTITTDNLQEAYEWECKKQ